MIPYAKPLIAVLAVGSIAAGGWFSRGWFEDSKRLAIVEDRQALAEEIRKDHAAIAGQVEARLAELKANERIIDRGVIREIRKPIYQRVCFEPELVELLNAAQRGESVTRPAESSD